MTDTLVSKLAKIMGEIESVPKNGYNSFHKYHYVTESDLVKAVSSKLSEAGIMIFSSIEDHELIDDPEAPSLTVLKIKYTITDGTNEITFYGMGYGSDKGDKGVYKAITGSMKYALMKTFLIDTGDDPEGDTKTDEAAARTAPRRVTLPSAQRGGYSAEATPAQIRKFLDLAIGELKLSRADLLRYMTEKTSVDLDIDDDTEPAEARRMIIAYLAKMDSELMAKLIDELPA